MIYSQHIDTINTDLNDLLGQAFDEEINISNEESSDKMDEEDENKEFRYDWMYLSEMRPNVRIQSDYNLGSRDMDRMHNWINDTQQHYSNTNITNAQDFVQQASSNSGEGVVREDDSGIEYQI